MEAIEARMHDREEIPQSSGGKHLVRLPTQAAVKVLLYQVMRAEEV